MKKSLYTVGAVLAIVCGIAFAVFQMVNLVLSWILVGENAANAVVVLEDTLSPLVAALLRAPWQISAVLQLISFGLAIYCLWPVFGIKSQLEKLRSDAAMATKKAWDFSAKHHEVVERLGEIEKKLTQLEAGTAASVEHSDRLFWQQNEKFEEQNAVRASNLEVLREAQAQLSTVLDSYNRFTEIDDRLSLLEGAVARE
jgi:membrane protein implicated in regulation of membrane protease activity